MTLEIANYAADTHHIRHKTVSNRYNWAGTVLVHRTRHSQGKNLEQF